MGLFCGTILTIRSKVGMMQQNYNVTDRVNYRADAKRFTHRRCKKLTSCQSWMVQKKHHVKNSSVNSANKCQIYRNMAMD